VFGYDVTPEAQKSKAMGMNVYDVEEFLVGWVENTRRNDDFERGDMAKCMDFTAFCDALNHDVHCA